MVRILSNGDIVQDEDPRPHQSRSRQTTPGRAQQGGIVHGNRNDEDVHIHGPSPSIFDSFNQRLLQLGVPRWNLGSYTIEPIVSLGFLLSMLMFGFKGLIFSGLLFAVVKLSLGRGDNTVAAAGDTNNARSRVNNTGGRRGGATESGDSIRRAGMSVMSTFRGWFGGPAQDGAAGNTGRTGGGVDSSRYGTTRPQNSANGSTNWPSSGGHTLGRN